MYIIQRAINGTFSRLGPMLKIRNYTTLDVNTKVIKDVILYKYENPRFYRMLNLFAISQFGFWSYLSYTAFTSLKDAPIPKDKDIPWWRNINLGDNKYKNTLSFVAFGIGYGILAIGWMYTLRSVKYLILRKGGEKLTLVTYTPFGNNKLLTVNLKDVCCKEMRSSTRSQLPLKIRNRKLHYILDMKGEFKNSQLFDNTAGLKRVW